MPHFSISQASIAAAIAQIVSFVVGFGVINNTQAGIIISAATAGVTAAFLIANSIHAFSHSNVVKPVVPVVK